MDRLELSITRQWFDSFALSFAGPEGDLHPLLDLKYHHSYRVEKNALAISKALDWKDAEVNLARAAGVVHDVGRFPQFANYGTFYDPHSVDHGEEGERVLMDEFPWEYISCRSKDVLLRTTRFHNIRSISGTLIEEDFLPILKIVRDADKLDVLEVVQENVLSGKVQELLPGISLAPSLSSEMIEEVQRGNLASYSTVRTLMDFLLLQLTWIYDINYLPTFSLLQQRGVMGWLDDFLSQDPETEGIRKDVRDYLNTRIS